MVRFVQKTSNAHPPFDTNVVTFLPYTYGLPYESDLIVKIQVQAKVPNKVLI